MNNLIIVGSGGHARACIDVIEMQNNYSIIGIIEKTETNKRNRLNYPIIGGDVDLPNLINSCSNLFLGFGFIKSSKNRSEYFVKAKRLNYNFSVIISPLSYISKTSSVNEGSIIMHHALINSYVTIGKNCIINSKALIEHDVVIGNDTHISTGSVINGSSKIGKECFIGSNSVVAEGIQIGDGSIVSAGAFVKEDIPPGTNYK